MDTWAVSEDSYKLGSPGKIRLRLPITSRIFASLSLSLLSAPAERSLL